MMRSLCQITFRLQVKSRRVWADNKREDPLRMSGDYVLHRCRWLDIACWKIRRTLMLLPSKWRSIDKTPKPPIDAERCDNRPQTEYIASVWRHNRVEHIQPRSKLSSKVLTSSSSWSKFLIQRWEFLEAPRALHYTCFDWMNLVRQWPLNLAN